MGEHLPNILIAEDDDEDKMLLEDALDEVDISTKIVFVSDGEEIFNYLEKARLNGTRLPAFILLDLNMPKKDGREALEELKNHPDYKCIPVIVLTTSTDDADIMKTYELGSSSFITKPDSYSSLLNIASHIKQYWLEIVKLPTNTETSPK